jgi:hypothetical protein
MKLKYKECSNKVRKKEFAKMNWCLDLQFTLRLEGVPSSDKDIEEQNNYNTQFLQNKTK